MKRNLSRYHRNIFVPNTFEDDIGGLLKSVNRKHWVWGFHAVRKLLESIDKQTARKIISLVYRLKVKSEDVFEVYYQGQNIEKFCVRVSLDDTLDLILVITRDKTVVTIYVNFKDHTHGDLDESLYEKE